jgi:hypothetical protein
MSPGLVYVLPGALALACAQPLALLALKSDRLARINGYLKGRRAILPPQQQWPQMIAMVHTQLDAENLIDNLDREIRARSYAPARELALLEYLGEGIRLHLDMLAIEAARQRELEAIREQQALRAREAAELERLHRMLEEQVRRAREYAQQQSNRRTEAAAARASTGWRRVLGLDAGESRQDVIKRAYRSLAQRHHPDKGGSENAMTELNKAFAAARKELRFR